MRAFSSGVVVNDIHYHKPTYYKRMVHNAGVGVVFILKNGVIVGRAETDEETVVPPGASVISEHLRVTLTGEH